MPASGDLQQSAGFGSNRRRDFSVRDGTRSCDVWARPAREMLIQAAAQQWGVLLVNAPRRTAGFASTERAKLFIRQRRRGAAILPVPQVRR